MKILFKNKTKYTKEVYNQFLEIHRIKYNFSYRLYTVITIILIFFCLTLQVQYHNYTLAVLFCIIFTIFFLWRFLHPFFIVNNELQSDKIINEKVFSFIFYDNFFKIRYDKSFYKLKYYKLYRIFDTNDFFYLYIDRNHAFLLNKNDFCIGNAKDFALFIKKKCRFKYSEFLKVKR